MKHIKAALQHMRRTPYQTLTALLIMSLTFFVGTLFILLAFFSSSLLVFFEKQPQITVFFEDVKTQEEIKKLQSELKADQRVNSIKYISKEQALEIYQEEFKEDPLLLEMVTAEILPAALEIKSVNAEDLDDLAKRIKKESGIEDIVYQKDIVDKLVSWTRSLRVLGGIFLTALLLETLLILLSVIGMRIVNKRREITILQLLGASAWYINLPFLAEGGLYGLTGAIVGWLLSYAILLYQVPFLSSLLEGIGKLTVPFLPGFTIWPVSFPLMLLILAAVSFAGFLLGIIGSFIAVRRYLR